MASSPPPPPPPMGAPGAAGLKLGATVRGHWNFDALSVGELEQRTQELIGRCRTAYDRVGDLNFEEVAFDNVIKQLADAECDYHTLRSPIEFPQHVSMSKELRNASTEASKKLEDFDVEMSMRKDIFDKIAYYNDKLSADLVARKPEDQRYVDRLIKLGKRNGLHLPHDVQFKIKTIKKKISELQIKFQHNLNEENTVLEFSTSELDGLPDDFINSLEKVESGKRKVTLKYPHFFPIVRKCRVPETRLTIDKAYHARCIDDNTPILEELVKLRQEQATLLNYPTHSAYVTELRMAKNPENVDKFLTDLKAKLQPLWKEERKLMLDFKKKECEEFKREFDGRLNYWDLRYYMAMVEEKMYSVDQNKLKEYFPLHAVTKGLLEIYQEILGLKFEEIKNAETWHPDVSMHNVHDASSGNLLGYFFLDLFPREGKYGHAAVFKLQLGCIDETGNRQVPVAAMLANFTKPTEDKPSLLDHKELETYFHEFGHVMHHMCALAEYAHFSGTKVERDFVEAPSQMLENWVWEESPLQRMSAHYQTQLPLPRDMIKRLVQSQKVNAGVFNLRQIVLATFDQMIHTTGTVNTQELFAKLFDEIVGIPPIPKTNMAAAFGHLAGGYDAQYYGYLWSEVYSCDMFATRFKSEGIMNPEIGMDYRRYILQPGGSMDAADMLKNFLGREPNDVAFLESKGIPCV